MDDATIEQRLVEARDLIDTQLHEHALAILDELNEAKPGAREISYWRAVCLIKLGRHAEAGVVCDYLAQVSDPRAVELRAEIDAHLAEPVSGPPDATLAGGRSLVKTAALWFLLALLAAALGLLLSVYIPEDPGPRAPKPAPVAAKAPAEPPTARTPPAERRVALRENTQALVRDYDSIDPNAWTPLEAAEDESVAVPAGKDLLLRPAQVPSSENGLFWTGIPQDSVQYLDLSKVAASGGGPAGTSIFELILIDPEASATAGETVLQEGAKTLAGLNLSGRGYRASDEQLRLLSRIPTLEELTLDGIAMTNRGMEYVSKLIRLRRLSIKNVGIRDDVLKHLANLPQLETLDLSHNVKLTDAALEFLKPLTTLRELYVFNVSFRPVTIQDLNRALLGCLIRSSEPETTGTIALRRSIVLPSKFMGKLTACSWNACAAGEWVAVEPELSEVHVPVTMATRLSLTNSDRYYLGDLESFHPDDIQEISLEGVLIEDKTLAFLGGLTGLRALDLSNTNITDAGLAHLAGLTALREFYLNNTHITDVGFEHLTNLRSLRRLEALGTSITGQGFALLRGLRSLRYLRVGPDITDRALKNIASFAELRELHIVGPFDVSFRADAHFGEKRRSFTGAGVTDEGIRNLRALTKLRHIHLNGNPVSDLGAGLLFAFMPTLRSVDLRETLVSETANAELTETYAGCDIKHSKLRRSVAPMDAGQPSKPMSLEKVPSRTVTFPSAHPMGRLLMRKKGAQRFYLWREAQGAIPVQSGNELMLSTDKISREGTAYLKRLRPNDLQALSINSPEVADGHLEDLEGLTLLQALSLKGTSVTDAGLDALKRLPYLHSLDVTGTKVTEAGLRKLRITRPGCSVKPTTKFEPVRPT